MTATRPSRRAWRWLAVLMILHMVLGLFYSIYVPPQEKLDEFIHWDYVRYLREIGLPDQRDPYIIEHTGEFHQPPLYYLLAAALTMPIPLGNPALTPEPINHFGFAFTLSAIPDNANGTLHDPANLRFPWRSDYLAAYVLRFFSLMCGTLALIPTFWLAWLLFESETLALGPVVWLGLRPSVLSINTTLSNDPLLLLLGTLILVLCAQVILHGITWRRSLVLGLLLGLTALTKFTWVATALMVPVAFILSPSWRSRKKQTIRHAIVAGAISLAIASWWFIRNLMLYGDLTGIGHGSGRANFIAPREVLAFDDLRQGIWLIFMRSWAHFGARGLPQWIYVVLLVATGLLSMGLIYLLVNQRYRRVTEESRLLLFIVMLSGLYLIQLAFMFPLTLFVQARFAYAGYAALALTMHLGFLGVVHWLRGDSRHIVYGTLVLAFSLVGLNVYALLGVLRPAYDLPKFLDRAQVEQIIDVPADIVFGDTIHLVGYAITPEALHPDETLFVTLCWESEGALGEAIPYGIHIIDRDTNKVGERNTHPGLGMYPTIFWEPGRIFCDRVRVPIDSRAPTSTIYDVTLRYFDEDTLVPLPATLSDGEPADIIYLGQIAILPEIWPPADKAHYIVGENVLTINDLTLEDRAFDTGDVLTVNLQYQAATDISVDLTAFVHVLDTDGVIVAQTDSRPRSGLFPTIFWPEGAVVDDSIAIPLVDVPSGIYRVIFGLYELPTAIRLPITTIGGSPQPDNVIDLGTIDVR